MNSEAKNTALVTFYSKQFTSRLQDTLITLDEQYGGILWFYYVFCLFVCVLESQSPFTTTVLKITATPFPCETLAVF